MSERRFTEVPIDMNVLLYISYLFVFFMLAFVFFEERSGNYTLFFVCHIYNCIKTFITKYAGEVISVLWSIENAMIISERCQMLRYKIAK